MIKHSVLLSVFLAIFAINGLTQIQPFQFDGYKDYPNGRRIAYFYLRGISCYNEEQFIMDNMMQIDKIYKFSIFPKKDNKNYCMIECNQNINEDYIFNLISQFETEYQNFNKPDPTFPTYINTGNPQEDNARYDEAKRKWIKENPEKYKKLAYPNGIKVNEPKNCKQ